MTLEERLQQLVNEGLIYNYRIDADGDVYIIPVAPKRIELSFTVTPYRVIFDDA